MVQFNHLCSMLGGRSKAGVLCEAVQGCAVLVQGCWVVRSEVLYAGEEGRAMRNARDYIVSVTDTSSISNFVVIFLDP